MRSETLSLVVAAPKDRLFAYLADLDNLPRWATEFCRGMRVVDGKRKIDTPAGELFTTVRADPGTGVIDMFAAPTEDALEDNVFPMRVLGLPDGSSVALVTMFQAPDLPDAAFEAQLASLRHELGNVARAVAA